MRKMLSNLWDSVKSDFTEGWNMALGRDFRRELQTELSNELRNAVWFMLTGKDPPKHLFEPKVQETTTVPKALLGAEVPFGVVGRKTVGFPADHHRHKVLEGGTGSGKTTWLINYALSLAKAGRGFAYLDNADGSAAKRILNALPEECLQRTVFLDYGDEYHPLPATLSAPDNDIFAQDSLTNWWINFFIDNFGIEDQWRTRELIGYCCRACFGMPDATVLEVIQMASNPRVRDYVLSKCEDKDVIQWWNRFEKLYNNEYKQAQMAASFLTRMGNLQTDRKLKHVLFQRIKEPFRYRKWMDEGYIVIISVPEDFGRLFTRTIMSLHMANFWNAALSRRTLPPNERKPYVIMTDEPQTWLSNNEQILDDVFSKARKYGLFIVCAFQDTSQIARESRHLAHVMFANTPDLILFRSDGQKDYNGIALHSLVDHEFICSTPGLEPFKAKNLPFAKPLGDRTYLIKACKEKYARSMQEVKNDIERREGSGWVQVMLDDPNTNEPKSGLPMNGSDPSALPGSQKGTDRFFGSSVLLE